MPSLPPRDGVDARICAGIRAGASTVLAVDRLTHVVGTSLPLPPTGEHDAIGGPSGIFLSPPCALREHGGGEVPTRGRTIARMGRWHPHLLPQRQQRHRRARPVLSCRLGLLPPTLYHRWGGVPPWRHAVLWNAVTSGWHPPCQNTQDLLMQIHGFALGRMANLK